jgi:hypothetical protein
VNTAKLPERRQILERLMRVTLNRKPIVAACVLSSLTLSGCGFGLTVPELQEQWDKPNDGDLMVKEISKTVYLSVEKAVVCVVENDKRSAHPGLDVFEKKWGVQMTLNLTILESTTLNPGLSFNTPMHAGVTNYGGEFLTSSTSPLAAITYPFVSTAQSYSLGLGGKAMSSATRTETAGAFYKIETLLQNARKGNRYTDEARSCDDQEVTEEARTRFYNGGETPSKMAQYLSLITNNDLKIHEWLKSSLEVEKVISGLGGDFATVGVDKTKALGQNAISHEVQFLVVTDGNITPTWKLVRVSANPSSTLFDTNRQRTHDLIVTFGPKDAKGEGLADAAKSTHNAALYGLSNTNGIRGVIQQP